MSLKLPVSENLFFIFRWDNIPILVDIAHMSATSIAGGGASVGIFCWTGAVRHLATSDPEPAAADPRPGAVSSSHHVLFVLPRPALAFSPVPLLLAGHQAQSGAAERLQRVRPAAARLHLGLYREGFSFMESKCAPQLVSPL